MTEHTPSALNADLEAARQAGTVAYNVGRPNVWHEDPTMVQLVPARLRGMADTEAVTRAFSEAWEDNAQHDRDREARLDAERAAALHESRMTDESSPEHAAAYGEPEHIAGPDGTCTDECVAVHPDHAETRGDDPATLLAEFDAWRDERAAQDDRTDPDDLEASDEYGAELAIRLADALRALVA